MQLLEHQSDDVARAAQHIAKRAFERVSNQPAL